MQNILESVLRFIELLQTGNLQIDFVKKNPFLRGLHRNCIHVFMLLLNSGFLHINEKFPGAKIEHTKIYKVRKLEYSLKYLIDLINLSR